MSHFTRPFTILHTEASMGWGGQEIRILREMIGMNERGWTTLIACHPESGLFLNALKHNLDVIPIYWSYKNSFSIWKRLREVIFECNVELVNTHSSVDAWLGGLIAKSCSLPVVRTRHLSTPIRGGWNAKILYGQLADSIVCTSQKAVQLVEEAIGSQTKALCVATGADTQKLERADKEKERTRNELGLKEGEIAVSTACVLRSWKGLEEFIEAAYRLQNQPHIHFFIFGGGPGISHYKNLLETKYQGAHVHFMGHREDIERYIAASDIFCLLSTAHEGISQATIQAAYLKKPLITTSTGGLTEVCIDNKTGKVVSPKKSSEVAQCIQELAENKEKRLEMGQNGFNLVCEKFTFSQTLDAMESVFASARFSRKA